MIADHLVTHLRVMAGVCIDPDVSAALRSAADEIDRLSARVTGLEAMLADEIRRGTLDMVEMELERADKMEDSFAEWQKRQNERRESWR